MYALSSLTPGERLFIWRRRNGMTVVTAAEALGTTPHYYKQWENDRAPDATLAPPVALEPLSTGEACTIARRRAHWSIDQMKEKLKWSHVTQIRWEAEPSRDKAKNPLYQWWQKKGWPPSPFARAA